MVKHIYKCKSCNKYTMKEICDFGNKTLIARPMKYLLNDKFGHYRRKAKTLEYTNRGLL